MDNCALCNLHACISSTAGFPIIAEVRCKMQTLSVFVVLVTTLVSRGTAQLPCKLPLIMCKRQKNKSHCQNRVFGFTEVDWHFKGMEVFTYHKPRSCSSFVLKLCTLFVHALFQQ